MRLTPRPCSPPPKMISCCLPLPAMQGAELIVALTHMRTPNDLILASQVPEIQVRPCLPVLGWSTTVGWLAG